MEPLFAEIYNRLQMLHQDMEAVLEGLSPAELDWTPSEEINSLGVLAVHLAGAERYWIGEVIGGDPAGRDRPAEFQTEGFSADELKKRLQASLDHSRQTLEKLILADIDSSRVSLLHGKETSVGWALVHALEHTALHVGHAQIMRQLINRTSEIR